ncbi:MAG: zinc-finger domain-containing protein [Xanthomonadaceae bacterium]|nr:zinc-finger domain-containing protein [Xanthomonadaceae bacterium]
MNTSTDPSRGKQPANAQSHYSVRRKDLPLSCPTPDMALWNSHPRVYLPIQKTGQAKCPYCGSEFRLED